MVPEREPPSDRPLRPRDLALLLLCSGDLRPRKRARDQQADRLGLDLKRRILQRVAALDPEPADLDATLVAIVEEMGSPTGPARAVALVVREEWQTACAAPEWVGQLLGEAMHQDLAHIAAGSDGSPQSEARAKDAAGPSQVRQAGVDRSSQPQTSPEDKQHGGPSPC